MSEYVEAKQNICNRMRSIELDLEDVVSELRVVVRRGGNINSVIQDLESIQDSMRSVEDEVDALGDDIEEYVEEATSGVISTAKAVLPRFSTEESMETHNLRMALWDAE